MAKDGGTKVSIPFASEADVEQPNIARQTAFSIHDRIFRS
ncbi:hypothetical protein NBRC3257_2062 [Gluconobacter thailandicus NBRC 3257]|uniref:Uncharacterized protein n=1 Tax=Gluconobacter thailandicus NBRC 3257 TaxID=1381097 RepID=A0ABQ0IZU7_GLUTH|nr:hypothetical protein NBRC3257_2062 [Gluconobacter thailandicus NBRC 3257]